LLQLIQAGLTPEVIREQFKQILKQHGEALCEKPAVLSRTLSNVLKPLLKAFTLYPKLSVKNHKIAEKVRHNSVEFQIHKYEPNIDEDSSGREILVLGGYAAEYLKSAL